MTVSTARSIGRNEAEIKGLEKFLGGCSLRQSGLRKDFQRFGIQQRQFEACHIAADGDDPALRIKHQRCTKAAEQIHGTGFDNGIDTQRACVVVRARVVGVAVHTVGAFRCKKRMLRNDLFFHGLCCRRFAVESRYFIRSDGFVNAVTCGKPGKHTAACKNNCQNDRQSDNTFLFHLYLLR